jgi:hypothetical protein
MQTLEMKISSALAYTNSKVVQRLQANYGYSEATANQIFFDTKQFLVMCAFENGKFTPTRSIDQGFHEFLMYSRDYDEYCHNYLPKKVHHVPDELNTAVDGTRAVRTLEAGERFFGKNLLSNNWRGEGATCSADCEAAACHCD